MTPLFNEWMDFSLIILASWFVIYIARPKVRKEMLWTSILTMPLGLTEPIFVPSYWNPPSLFNLAASTGFDIESLIFCFAVGGIASVLYEALYPVSHHKAGKEESRMIHRFGLNFHRFAIISPVLVYVPMYILTKINSIYIGSFSMLVGGIMTYICRPDLTKKIITGGLLFTLIYFLFFLSFNLAFPGAVYRIWNLPALSGILFFDVPLEELMFAFTFGLMWSSLYEHLRDYRLHRR
jgi:hypothetical protein